MQKPNITSGFKPADLSEERRRLILAVAGDDLRCLPLIHPLEELKRRDEIYRWCVRNRVVGTKFYELSQHFRFSWNQLAIFILKRIDRDDRQALYRGKDFRR